MNDIKKWSVRQLPNTSVYRVNIMLRLRTSHNPLKFSPFTALP